LVTVEQHIARRIGFGSGIEDTAVFDQQHFF
jgi:hypothetical protein